MRLAIAALSIVAALSFYDSAPAAAQAQAQISGKTCRALHRSCFRICGANKGKPEWQACEVDCNNGLRTCRTTGTWVSKNATVKPVRGR
jgi:hypothetical protein